MGNGYRRIIKDASQPNIKVVIDCKACDNQGEIKNDEKNIEIWNFMSPTFPKDFVEFVDEKIQEGKMYKGS